MLHFRMDMPLYLMAFYGSMMIVVVLLLRSILKNHLPKPVFPLLWGLVLIRLLVPFSLSSPISAPVPEWPLQHSNSAAVYISDLAEDAVTPGTGASNAVTPIADWVSSMEQENLSVWIMSWIPYVLRYFGRVAAPVFMFCVVEGFLHTRNIKKYILGIFSVALLAQIECDWVVFRHSGYLLLFRRKR